MVVLITVRASVPTYIGQNITVLCYNNIIIIIGDCHLPPAYQHMTTQVAQSTAPPPQM